MSTELRFLPHKPKDPAAPTAAEIQSAFLVLDGALVDVTTALKVSADHAWEAGDAARRLVTNYETSFSITREYPVAGRDFRQMAKNLARAFRRPALIHNGRKPR